MKKSIKNINRLIIVLFCIYLALFPAVTSFAQSVGTVSGINKYKSLLNLSDQELYDAILQLLERNEADSAALYYNILAQRTKSDDFPLKDKNSLASLLNQIGVTYYRQGNYANAMSVFLESQSLCEVTGADSLLADVLKNIGNIYSSYTDYEKGKECYEKAFDLIKNKGCTELENKVLNNLFGVSCFMGNKEEAEKYYALLMANETTSNIQTYDLIVNKGILYLLEKDYENAIRYFTDALDFAVKQKLDTLSNIGVANSQLANIYILERKMDSAIFYLQHNELVAEKTQAKDLQVETYRSLYKVYRELGDKKKADYYHESYLNLSDSIFSMNEFNRLKNAQVLYEMNKSNKIINSLVREQETYEAQISFQRKILLIVIIALVTFLILSLVVFRQKRKIENAYRSLFLKNKESIESEQRNKKRVLDYEMQLKQANEKIKVLEQKNMEEEEKETDDSMSKEILLTSEQRDTIINRINEIMDDTKEFCEYDFTLNKLAHMIESNTRYVSFIINDVYKKNFKTFLNEYRIKESMLRLLDTQTYGNYTIKAIAESVGYRSQTNFIMVFKKITGLSPSVYQKLALEQREAE